MKRILIVDDLADNRYLLRAMLTGHGYAVDEARHGAEALALARANPPDLAITDLLMPVMDGYTLLRHWRLDPQLKSIPLVVYTATYTDVQDEQLARDLGADDFLLKPTDPQVLLQALRNLLDQVDAGSLPARQGDQAESRVLAVYSQALFRKLEDKLLESENLNQQLRFSQTRLAAILDTEPECVQVLDAQCRILDINAAGLRLLGAQSQQEVLGLNLLPMVGPEHRQAFEQFVARVFRGERGSIEFRCFPPGGGSHWVEIHAAPLQDGEGKVAALLGISHDITSRKRAEGEAVKERQLRELLLQSVADGVHGLDVHGRVIFENAAAQKMFARSEAEMIGQPAHALIHHHHADGLPYAEEDCPIYRTLSDGQPRRVSEEVFFRKDGTSFPVEYSCNAILDESGSIRGAVVCFRDVSMRKQAEAAAEKNRRHFESLFENAPVAVWLEDFSAVQRLLGEWGLLGQDGATLAAHFAAHEGAFSACLSAVRVLEVNRACLTMHGASAKEELLQGLSALVVEESRQALLQQYAAIAEDRTELEFQSRVRTLAGEERQVQVRWVAMPGCEGSYEQVLVTLEDISAQLQAQARIEHLSRLYATLSQVNQIIVRVKSRQDLFPAICQAAWEHGRFLRAWIGLWDSAAGMLSIIAANGYGEEKVRGEVFDLSSSAFKGGFLQLAVGSGQMVVVGDLARESAAPRERELARRDGVRGGAVVPFMLAGKVAGVLTLASAEAQFFNDAELQRLLVELGTDISFALDSIEAEALRLRSEQAELHQRSLLDATLQSLPGIFYLFTAEGRFLRWNRGFEQASGYSAEEIAMLHPTDLFEGEEKELIAQRIARVFSEGSANAEAHFLAKDGRRTPHYFTGQLVHLEGRPHLVGVGVDLSERRRAEKALRDLAHAVNTAGDVVFLTDREGIITQVNERFCSLYGYNADELVGQVTPRILKSGKQSEEFYSQVWETLLRGETIKGEIINRARDGRLIEIEETITPFADDRGELAGFLAVQREISARRRAEKALKDLAQAVNASGDVVFTCAADGTINSVNAQFTRLYGYTSEEVVGKTTPRILKSGKHSLEIYQHTWAALLRGETVRCEVVNRCRDGRLIDIETSATPFYDGQGQLAGFLAIQRDISDRKRAEAESRLLQSIALGVGAAGNLDDALTFVLAQVCQTNGWAYGEAWLPNSKQQRLECHSVWHGPSLDLEAFQAVSHNTRLGEGQGLPGSVWRSRQAEWMFDVASDAHFYRQEAAARAGLHAGLAVPVLAREDVVLVLAFYLFESGAEDLRRKELIEAVAAQIGSLMERKRIEAERAASEAQFRSLIENASDLVTVVDAQGIILFQGPSSERLLGFQPEELLGRSAFTWIHPEDAAGVVESLQRALAQPGVPTTVEFRFHHRDGSWRRLESLGRSIRSESGPLTIAVNSRDVTEHRRLEEHLRQAQKMEAIGHLAGGVAHDFNNILAVILMQTDLMRMEEGLSTPMQEGLRQLRSAAERGANLTRQLLLFGRKQVLHSRVLDLNDVVSNLGKMLQRLIGEDVKLELHLHSEPLLLHADAGMLDQVLLNLAVNARDAMPAGGRLRIQTSLVDLDAERLRSLPELPAGRYASLLVSDSGSGISPDVLPHIFEPFFTTKGPGKGTGLGLATVFGIVKQHHGGIQVRSEAGRGSSFELYLPLLAAEEANAQPAAQQAARRGGSETILLVEDDPAVRRLAREMLERHGYRVVEASSGAEALSLMPGLLEAVALLLTDMVMPEGVGGKELARHLLAIKPGLKVVYMSGYSAEMAGRELALPKGEHFIQKPFTSESLLEAVRRGLDGPGRA